MYSPWGKVDRIEKYTPGLVWVSTPSHGGFMVTKTFARQNLSPAAIKRGDRYGNYLAYEEDIDWAIVAFELPMFWGRIFAYMSAEAKQDPMSYLMQTLSAWRADYLIERGIQPVEPEYSRWLLSKEDEGMRREKHPDLIVTAWGDWFTKQPGICQVATADGKEYLVTCESYSRLQETGGLLLLSQTEIVEAGRKGLSSLAGQSCQFTQCKVGDRVIDRRWGEEKHGVVIEVAKSGSLYRGDEYLILWDGWALPRWMFEQDLERE